MTIHELPNRMPVRRGMTAALAALCLALTACSSAGSEASSSTTASTTTGVAESSDSSGVVETASDGSTPNIDDTHADDNDGDYDEADATTISLADGATSTDGSGASVSDDIVTISSPGTYIVSGELTDGQIVVNSVDDGKVRLVLDGATIASSSTSPIVFTEADEAVVVLAEGSVNSLSDSSASGADDDTDDAPTGTLFSMADLTIAGTGTLNVTGASNDGITSKDGLVILSGTINVDAVDDAIRGKDYLYVAGGTITVDAGGDGLKSDNENEGEFGWVQVAAGTVTVSAGAQGLDGYGAVTVTGGEVSVTDSNEGLQAMAITMAGGDVSVVATDDGLNATAHTADGGAEDVEDGVVFTMTGGTLTVAAGSDGLDSNGVATITGGTLAIATGASSNGGNGALDVNGTLDAPGIVVFDATGTSAGSHITIVNSGGEVVATFDATTSATSFTATATDIVVGDTYTVFVDDVEVATTEATDASESVAGGRGGGGRP